MENATKALIIAAAILIAIVLISLGVFVLGQGTTMVKENSDMTAAEVSTYNSKFEAYLGSNVSGTKVKQLVTVVNQHNKANNDDESRKVTLVGDVEEGSTDYSDFEPESIRSGYTYEVKDVDSTNAGLISKIQITKN